MLGQTIDQATKINTLTRMGFYMFEVWISSLEKKFLTSKKRIIHLYREPIVFFFCDISDITEGNWKFRISGTVLEFPIAENL